MRDEEEGEGRDEEKVRLAIRLVGLVEPLDTPRLALLTMLVLGLAALWVISEIAN